MKNSNGDKNPYTHILQKVGVLRNFSVAKVIPRKQIEDLKKLIRAVSKSEAEYQKILKEEMFAMSNMHDPKFPIPGIIYNKDIEKRVKYLQSLSQNYTKNLKNNKLSKKEYCYLISSIIRDLGLSKEDFLKLRDDANLDDSDDAEDIDSENESENY